MSLAGLSSPADQPDGVAEGPSRKPAGISDARSASVGLSEEGVHVGGELGVLLAQEAVRRRMGPERASKLPPTGSGDRKVGGLPYAPACRPRRRADPRLVLL